MKVFYAICFILGTILPYSQFAVWLGEKGLDVSAFVEAIVSNRISAFAWLDVLVSAVTLLVFSGVEGRWLGMRALRLPIPGTLSVGVSCGLPLFLLMREIRVQRTGTSAGASSPW